MHTQSLSEATCWHSNHPHSPNPVRAAPDAPNTPMPSGLSQAELRQLVLDLIG
jgi:hypothetical protein